MSINIACSVLKCVNPVIGQCTGYKKTCKRYYCHEHSTDILCFDCASQKTADEHAELIYQEYLALAEKVSREPFLISPSTFTFQDFMNKEKKLIKFGTYSLIIGIAFLIFFVLSSIVSEASTEVFLLALILMGTPILIGSSNWFSYRSDIIEDQKEKLTSDLVRKIDSEKHGFSEFWNAWVEQRKEEKAEKNKQILMGVLTVVGVIVAGAIASELTESEYDRTRRAVRDEMNSK